MPLRGRRITNTAFTGISIKEIPRPPAPLESSVLPPNQPLRPSGARASFPTRCARPAPVVKPGICGAGGDGNCAPPRRNHIQANNRLHSYTKSARVHLRPNLLVSIGWRRTGHTAQPAAEFHSSSTSSPSLPVPQPRSSQNAGWGMYGYYTRTHTHKHTHYT